MIVVERNTVGTQSLSAVKMKLQRISEKAKANPDLQFTSLAHLITVDLLKAAFQQLRKNASPGIDGVTARTYEKDLLHNLEDLHRRLKEERYRAQPARRVYIEKENGKLRPLGIPCLEDKIVQRAVVFILEPIYEADFLNSSYGFRPKRGSHNALDAIYEMLVHRKVDEVLDADITSYFDNVVKSEMMRFLQRRIKDRSLLRLLNKWLRAGVLSDGELLMSDKGTPQGSVISPLLANIYLHYVLDIWLEQDVKPRLAGAVHLVRYADDFVIGFQYRKDAERVQEVLPKRFAKYGLELSPEKTSLIPFGRFATEREARKGKTVPTFDFLGFTHICGKNRKTGRFVLELRTMAKRFRRSLRNVNEWCRRNRHRPLPEQQQHLARMLAGHYQYYGRRTNMPRLKEYFTAVKQIWGNWLRRRSERCTLTWKRFYKGLLARLPLPQPRITQVGYREFGQLTLTLLGVG